jgi:hypothetical protein
MGCEASKKKVNEKKHVKRVRWKSVRVLCSEICVRFLDLVAIAKAMERETDTLSRTHSQVEYNLFVIRMNDYGKINLPATSPIWIIDTLFAPALPLN